MNKQTVRKPYIIGIAGTSASGKGFLSQAIRIKMEDDQVAIISQDNYYKPVEEQKEDKQGHLNFDQPDAIDFRSLAQDIMLLVSGETLHRTSYSFNQAGVEGKPLVLSPAPIIIVEGFFILHYPVLQSLLDLKVYVDVPSEVAVARRIERDTKERGIPHEMIEYQLSNHVAPAEEEYLLPYRSAAHLVVNNSGNMGTAVEVICNHLTMMLSR